MNRRSIEEIVSVSVFFAHLVQSIEGIFLAFPSFPQKPNSKENKIRLYIEKEQMAVVEKREERSTVEYRVLLVTHTTLSW